MESLTPVGVICQFGLGSRGPLRGLAQTLCALVKPFPGRDLGGVRWLPCIFCRPFSGKERCTTPRMLKKQVRAESRLERYSSVPMDHSQANFVLPGSSGEPLLQPMFFGPGKVALGWAQLFRTLSSPDLEQCMWERTDYYSFTPLLPASWVVYPGGASTPPSLLGGLRVGG